MSTTGKHTPARWNEQYVLVHRGQRTFNARTASNSKPTHKKEKKEDVPRKTPTPSAPRFDFSGVVDDRPGIEGLNLPGIRREREGRGGAHGPLQVARMLARSPLTNALASTIPARTLGRPQDQTDTLWFCFMQMARELGSYEAAEATLNDETIWGAVAKEFWFEHRQLLSTRPPTASAYYHWREAHLRPRIQQLMDQHTVIAALLAAAIQNAEAGLAHQPNILNPHIWDIVAADGTVMRSASDVREETVSDASGESITFTSGSRAKHGARRVGTGNVNASGKRSGADAGFMTVSVTTKGRDTYTRVLLAFDLSNDDDKDSKSEISLAQRCLHRLFNITGAQFPVLVYDGLLMPANYQAFLRDHGVITVSRTHARRKNKRTSPAEKSPTDGQTGWSTEQYGNKKKTKSGETKMKRTYVTDLGAAACLNGGTKHAHHLVADNGSVYEVPSRELLRSAPDGVGVHGKTRLEPIDARILLDRNTEQHLLELTFTGRCSQGGTFEHHETLSPSNRDSTIPLGDLLGNVRVIAEDDAIYCDVAGTRNQIESFFSWLEKRHFHKDRASAYKRDDLLSDLLAAAMLHNSEAWAHLLHRHPEHAAAFDAALRETMATTVEAAG